MKKTNIAVTMLCLAACLAAADTKITWLADVTADRAETVTGVQSGQVANAAAHINRTDNPHGVTAAQIGALTAELDPVANAALVLHKNRTDNPHGVTAAQIGALTAETDTAALAALAAYAAYWPPNATASSWFTFTTNANEITITGYNIAGGTDVVIPDYINGWPVTAIGRDAFRASAVVSLIAPQTVTSIEGLVFYNCPSLTSVSLPQVQTIGVYAFSDCISLTSVSLPQVQTIGVGAFGFCTSLASVSLPQVQTVGAFAFDNCSSLTSLYFDSDAPTIENAIFNEITANQVTIYVTNPQATGWGATLGGMPVVRLPLYADAIYQAGGLVATVGHVAQAIAAIPEPDLSDRPTFAQIAASNALPYTAWTGTLTLQNGTATVAYAHGNMPVLVVPDSGATTYVTVATGTYVATSGVSRVSLSIWAGTNAIELVTNEVDYASTPDIPTNRWGTILFRRVSDGRWKGVGL